VYRKDRSYRIWSIREAINAPPTLCVSRKFILTQTTEVNHRALQTRIDGELTAKDRQTGRHVHTGAPGIGSKTSQHQRSRPGAVIETGQLPVDVQRIIVFQEASIWRLVCEPSA